MKFRSLVILIAFTTMVQIFPLNCMNQELSQKSKIYTRLQSVWKYAVQLIYGQQNQLVDQEQLITEMLCCMTLNDTPSDVMPLIIKPIVLLNFDQLLNNNLDTTSPEKLFDSLLKIYNLLVKSDKFGATDEQLGAVFAHHLMQQDISLPDLINQGKNTVLHCAIRSEKRSAHIVHILCIGAGENAIRLISTRDVLGWAGVDLAIFYNQPAILRILRDTLGNQAKTIIMQQDSSQSTALHTASFFGYVDTVKEILDTPGIDVKALVMATDSCNQTALDTALMLEWHEVVALLQPHTN